MDYTPEQLADLFRDYFNNFINIETFARHYQISETQARKIIKAGRAYHNQQAKS